MPTLFTHPLIPIATMSLLGRAGISRRLLFVACVVSILPDIDILAFSLGIPYESQFGHRGFTHSIIFSLGLGLLAVMMHKCLLSSKGKSFILVSVAGISHGVLDALTNGGLGIAFFWPLNETRYFLPWTPLEVSPIGAGFLSQRGAVVLVSEFIWIWLPSLLLISSVWLLRKLKQRVTQ